MELKRVLLLFVLVFVLLCGTFSVYAAGDPAVTVVSPSLESTLYADNFLVSVKVTEAKTYSITVYEEKERIEDGTLVSLNLSSLSEMQDRVLVDVAVGTAETFVSANSLSFYTKQVNEVTPGLYRIKVDSLNSAGQTSFSTDSYFIVKAKSEKPAEEIFESQQTGLLKSLQAFLKKIFNN